MGNLQTKEVASTSEGWAACSEAEANFMGMVIRLKTFKRGFKKQLLSLGRARAKVTFAAMDTDANGTIDKEEFFAFVKASPIFQGKCTELQLEYVFQTLDANGDEEISFEEISAWVGKSDSDDWVGTDQNDDAVAQQELRQIRREHLTCKRERHDSVVLHA
jgi:hypothetical protein